MQVLVMWSPHVRGYFKGGHHVSVFSIAAYLRGKGHVVNALDAGR